MFWFHKDSQLRPLSSLSDKYIVGFAILGQILKIPCYIPLPSHFPDKIADEAMAKEFLVEYNHTAEAVWNAYTEASWAYNVNITDYNKQIMVGPSWDSPGVKQAEWEAFLLCCLSPKPWPG